MTDELPVPPLAELRTRQSAKWRTYPSDVLPLTVAEMDFPLAPPVAAALQQAVARSDTGYALASPDLGKALAGFAGRRWDWDLDPTSVTSVTDVGVGVVELLRVLTRPGDRVVISPPVYPPFFHWAPEAGTELLEVPLTEDYRLDLPALDRAFATQPGVYVLCHPHNPVGRVHSRGELTELVTLAKRHGVVVISDEIHAPLVLPGAEFTPLLTVPGAADVAISLMSASKAWNLAGLKCAAAITASPAMADVVARMAPDIRWRTGHFGVLASIAAFTDSEPWLEQLLSTLVARRALLGELLAEHLPSVRWQPPSATYLAWLDCSAIGPGDTVRDLFLVKGKVALEPGSRFGAPGDGCVRLNFGTSAELLEQAVTGMAAALA
ncbi:MalY/PatB family protein [Labedaea rhizosphaerae]|uniref:cysteine-S-conjugate beta-lyase n=1 Tax=Labedaea rhizosphaerae TaxID=598644 RepID=A0A4R6SIP9_LABRH|nr:aminotransferase class I/II-fold pyridoxal phosphate-dependent enzyme [Labedaea rhizosphaerae]TDQ01553.1 cystathionine beta-lyase [Labedaea rhizosphaerae]